MEAELLKVNHLTVRFGGLTAVNDVDFSIFQNEIASLIGPNGAGKTTTLRAIAGIARATGSITFKDGSATLGTGTLAGGVTTLIAAFLSPGSHSITAMATDVAGNTGPASGATTLTVDSTPPAINFAAITGDNKINLAEKKATTITVATGTPNGSDAAFVNGVMLSVHEQTLYRFDPATRTAPIEIEIPNPNYRLKPGTTPVRHTGQERATEEFASRVE